MTNSYESPLPLLSFEFVLTVELGPVMDVGDVGRGRRLVFPVVGGTVQGPHISGLVLAGGADWALAHPHGRVDLDVRVQVRTAGGDAIHISYTGTTQVPKEVAAALGECETGFGENYFWCHVRMESGSPVYAGLSALLFVGRGRFVPGGVQYEVFALS
jgi:hypothetical protein